MPACWVFSARSVARDKVVHLIASRVVDHTALLDSW